MGFKSLHKKALSSLLALSVIGTMTASLPFAANATAPDAGVSYKVYGQSYGWSQAARADGAEAGTEHQSKRIEALKVSLTGSLPSDASIVYQVHGQSYGWNQSAKADGAEAGTEHQSKRVEAIRITLKNMAGYAVSYRVYQQSYGWSNWATTQNGTDISNAAVAGVTGKSKRVEAIEIKLLTSTANVSTADELNAALADSGITAINLTADITASPKITRPVTINFGSHTITGDVSFSYTAAGSSALTGDKGNRIIGNLSVDTANGSFNNGVKVSGKVNVINIASGVKPSLQKAGQFSPYDQIGNSGWTESADGNTMTISDGNGGVITITGHPGSVTVSADASGALTISVNPGGQIDSITSNAPVAIVVSQGASVSNITATAGAAGTTITNNGTAGTITTDVPATITVGAGATTTAINATAGATGTTITNNGSTGTITTNTQATITVGASGTATTITAASGSSGTTITNNGSTGTVNADVPINLVANQAPGSTVTSGSGTVTVTGSDAGKVTPAPVTPTAPVTPVTPVTPPAPPAPPASSETGISVKTAGVSIVTILTSHDDGTVVGLFVMSGTTVGSLTGAIQSKDGSTQSYVVKDSTGKAKASGDSLVSGDKFVVTAANGSNNASYQIIVLTSPEIIGMYGYVNPDTHRVGFPADATYTNFINSTVLSPGATVKVFAPDGTTAAATLAVGNKITVTAGNLSNTYTIVSTNTDFKIKDGSESVLTVDAQGYIYVANGTKVSDLLGAITSKDGSDETFEVFSDINETTKLSADTVLTQTNQLIVTAEDGEWINYCIIIKAAGTAAAVKVGTSTVNYTLTSGTFDLTKAAVATNWELDGQSTGIGYTSLLSIVSVSIKDNTHAVITVSGMFGPDDNYTIAPKQEALDGYWYSEPVQIKIESFTVIRDDHGGVNINVANIPDSAPVTVTWYASNAADAASTSAPIGILLKDANWATIPEVTINGGSAFFNFDTSNVASGTYYFKFSVDGISSDFFTVKVASITVTDNGNGNYTVATTNVADGSTLSLHWCDGNGNDVAAPAGVTVGGSTTITGNAATVTISGGTAAGAYHFYLEIPQYYLSYNSQGFNNNGTYNIFEYLQSSFTLDTDNDTLTITLVGGTFINKLSITNDFMFSGDNSTDLAAGTITKISDTQVTITGFSGLTGSDTVIVKPSAQDTPATSVTATPSTSTQP